jgi:hypothetical protein
MTSSDCTTLSRRAHGDGIRDQQIARLREVGLAEVAFGHAVLTRPGRATVGTYTGE